MIVGKHPEWKRKTNARSAWEHSGGKLILIRQTAKFFKARFRWTLHRNNAFGQICGTNTLREMVVRASAMILEGKLDPP